MQESNHLMYSLRVWLTAVFVAPVFLSLYFSIAEMGWMGFMIIPYAVAISFVCSIPNWILLILFVWLINKTKMEIAEKKMLITYFSIFVTMGLFFLLFSWDTEMLSYSIPYYFVLIFGIWFYKLIPSIDQPEQIKISPRLKVLEDILDDEIF